MMGLGFGIRGLSFISYQVCYSPSPFIIEIRNPGPGDASILCSPLEITTPRFDWSGHMLIDNDSKVGILILRG
jgi:hypothetical protein